MKRKNILISGGGRWARTLTTVLLGGFSDISITIFTPHNFNYMYQWVATKGFSSCVQVRPFHISKSTIIDPKSVLFVVNSARDHELSAAWAIHNNIPVLIEKPFTTSSESTLDLIKLADQKSTFLAPAHVFLFASYFLKLKDLIATSSSITSIAFNWYDSPGEYRHGDIKSFDISLPIFADVFPHIYSILDYLFPNSFISDLSLSSSLDQPLISIQFSFSGIPVKLLLSRYHSSRERLISFTTTEHSISLDFTSEPVSFSSSDPNLFVESSVPITPSPLLAMSRAFLQSCFSSQTDSRFDSSVAYRSSLIVESLFVIYENHMSTLLFNIFSKSSNDNYSSSDIYLSELIMVSRRNTSDLSYMLNVSKCYLMELLSSTPSLTPCSMLHLLRAKINTDI